MGVLTRMHQDQRGPKRRVLLLLLGWSGRVFKYLLAGILFFFLTAESVQMGTLALFIPALALVELSALLPIQGLGGFGTWEGAFVLVFSRVFPHLEDPLLIGLGLHVLTQLGEYLLGGLAWMVFLFRPRYARSPQDGPGAS